MYSNDAKQEVQKTVNNLFPYSLFPLLSSKKAAFTLAEMLIVIAIVGVVAALTLPTLIQNIQSQVKAKRIENIEQKISKASDKMLATSGMTGYEDTMAFVTELSKHLSVAKICTKNNLRACWPYDEVIINTRQNIKVNISEIQTAAQLKMTTKSGDWQDTVGIITSDGTPMILSYNKACEMEQTTTPIWSSSKSTSTNCIAGVYDWNGAKKPNTYANLINGAEKNDVISFNSGGLGSECLFLNASDSKCLSAPFKPTAEEAQAHGTSWCGGYGTGSAKGVAAALGIKNCWPDDYWAAAVDRCGGTQNMVQSSDLYLIVQQIYELKNPPTGLTTNVKFNGNIAKSLGFSSEPFGIFTKSEGSDVIVYSSSLEETRFIPRTNGSRRTNFDYGICVEN